MRFVLIVLLLIQPVCLLAHGYGHDSASLIHARIWRYPDKRLAATGSFISVRNGCVQVATDQGHVVSVTLNELSWIDKNYVARQQARIAGLNASLPVQSGTKLVLPEPFGTGSLLLILLTLLVATLTAVGRLPVSLSAQT